MPISRDGETLFLFQETSTLKQSAVCLLLVTCCLTTPSYETSCDSYTNITSLLSSLPTLQKPSGEAKLSRRSPLNHGYVVGIDDAHRALTPISHDASTVPYLLSRVEAHGLPSDVAHVTKSDVCHVAHDLSVTGHASQHSVTKLMSFGNRDCDRYLNHDPAKVLQQVTHALVPTITHVTTTTLSEHGVTKSPTVTVLEHSLVPVAALNSKPSHGLSKPSTVTLAPESLTSTVLAVNGDQASNNRVLTTFTSLAQDGLLHHLPVTHTVVQKVSTLTHDPDPVLTHDVSVTHITDSALVTHKLQQLAEHRNVFRTHYGGYGVGIDFGGHGSGHGFYV